MGLTRAIRHWRSCFWGQPFVVRTDHYSLKYLLEQRIAMPSQQRWLCKLLGFDFTIEYKSGRLNIVADALSRSDSLTAYATTVSIPSWDFLADIKAEHNASAEIQQLVRTNTGAVSHDKWSVIEGLLLYKNRIFLQRTSPLIPRIIASIHNSFHEGYQKTLQRVSRDFFWVGMRLHIKDAIATCVVCQRNKVDQLQPAGLLQPLPIPHQIWAEISMDFVEGLPSSHGKSVILVVVDRFSKYAYFIAIAHPYSAVSVAKIFFDNVFKLHGLPESIVSDRDVTFTSSFWKELFRLQGTKLCFSSSYHPQSDGQTEAVNRVLEMYLRCFTSDYPKKWGDWLACAEYCYNTSFHSSLRASPFEVIYERKPPRLEAVDQALLSRDKVLLDVRERLLHAQNRMKVQFDNSHRELHFKVLERIGSVAYRLQLPETAKMHPVFHISFLKQFWGTETGEPTLPAFPSGERLPTPQAILDQRVNKGRTQLLVHWHGLSPAEASWEDASFFTKRFPSFVFADKHRSQGEVMSRAPHRAEPYKEVQKLRCTEGTHTADSNIRIRILFLIRFSI